MDERAILSELGKIRGELGEIRGEVRGVNRRLDDGSRRHSELDDKDDALDERVAKLELIEAKRAGGLAAFAALGTVIGGALTLLLQHFLRKVGIS